MTSWTIRDSQELAFDAVHVLRVELVSGHVDVVATHDAPRLEVTSVEGEPLTVTQEGTQLTIGYDDIPLGGVFGLEGSQTWERFREWGGFERGRGESGGEHTAGPWGAEGYGPGGWHPGPGGWQWPGWGRPRWRRPGWHRPGGPQGPPFDDPRAWLSNVRRSATLAVAVPEACQVQLASVSAEAVVSGVAGQVRARGVSGGLTFDGLSGGTQVQTVSGGVQARSLRGPLDFATASGELTVASGESDDVRVKSVNGRVTIDLAPPPRGKIDVKTVSGGVSVRLPDTASVDVDLTSMTGNVDAAFEGLAHERKPGRVTLSGHVGEGSGRLRAKTVSGDIALLRRPPAVTKGKESA
ncbi:MAG: DUF4097 family beta strand repeat-containing protein [Streptosporangiaceae bacterium]